MARVWSLMVWVVETICLAFGVAVAMYLVVVVRSFTGGTRLAAYGPGQGSGHIGDVFALAFIMFYKSGYFITAALASMFLPRDRWFWYPTVIAGLFLVHSLMFFQALSSGFFNFSGSFLAWAMPLFGTVIAFAVAELGDRIRGTALTVSEAEGDDQVVP